jgi:hypothetical protein
VCTLSETETTVPLLTVPSPLYLMLILNFTKEA